MPRVNVHRLAAVVVGLWVLGAVLAGGASAQQPAAPNPLVPATLRLAQVVPRLPVVHLFALAQSDTAAAVAMQPSELKALVGSDPLPVDSRDDEGIAFIFLIDVSGSMRSQLDGIKDAIRWWIDSMTPADRAAVVTLGSRVQTVVNFTPDRGLLPSDKDDLKRKISALTAQDPDTLLYQGMIQAMDLARRVDLKLPLRRAIVMLTDGLDDQQGGAGRQQAVDAMAIDPIPIYGIGASDKSPKVDAALKDFSALVYASGGAYRRVEVPPRSRPDPGMLAQKYRELRDVVASTRHFTADCKSCNPDGSPVVVRLRLTQGPVEINSGSVTVLAVGTKGKPDPRPAAPIPPPTQVAQAAPPVVSTPIAKPDPPPSWTINLRFFLTLPWQWVVLAVLVLAALIAGLIAVFIPKPKSTFETTRIIPDPGPTRPVENPDSIFQISRDVSIAPGTEQHKQRLRLTPLGTNDLPAEEAIFEGDLSVGRSPDNKVYIYNDTQVSSKHCTLSPKDRRILVTDEGSRNGTRVNGVPIEGFIHAEPDSVLGVGRTEMRMQLLAPGRL
jgi:Mg-chelatase subunit ChlD